MLAPLITPLASIIDQVIPDAAERDRAKLRLLALQGSPEMQELQKDLSAILAERNANDAWTGRARPTFLYVMYVILLWSVPMGILGAFEPGAAKAIAGSMTAYLNGLPEPLYALFGTGYLGYTAARQWGKISAATK